ncbi:hypothetical protein AOLI_G00283650 [Acnodon oligacanthus]
MPFRGRTGTRAASCGPAEPYERAQKSLSDTNRQKTYRHDPRVQHREFLFSAWFEVTVARIDRSARTDIFSLLVLPFHFQT